MARFSEGRKIESSADCFEGWRFNLNPELQKKGRSTFNPPLYRQVNIGSFVLKLEKKHLETPSFNKKEQNKNARLIFPGDVIIPKNPPIRAALTSSVHPQHPADGNCFIIRCRKDTSLRTEAHNLVTEVLNSPAKDKNNCQEAR